MFCRMCGSQMGEDEKFCSNCGAPASETPAAPTVPEVPVTPVAAPAPVVPAPAAPAAGNPLLNARSNPLYLAAVICMSVMAAFSLFNVITTLGVMFSYLNNSYYYSSDASAAGMVIGATVSALGALTITAIILAGLWLVYASGVGQRKEANLTRGLKLVRGGMLAQMIYMIVILALAALLILVAVIMGSGMGAYDFDDYYYGYGYRAAGSTMAAMGVVLLLLLAGVGALMIVFYVKVRTALGHALAAAQTGTATGVPSMFLIVMCFVIAGCTLLSILSVLSGGLSSALGVISSLCSAAASILFGIVALQYRNQVLAS